MLMQLCKQRMSRIFYGRPFTTLRFLPVLLGSAILIGSLAPFDVRAAADDAAKPRLVLQITVDALRGDLPRRYSHVLGEGGFRYLMEQGVDFTNAHYLHANTETIVGHVSLATGSVPAAHGMVGNVWFDREQGRLVYNIEDADYRLLSADSDVDQSTEIDPTQKAAKVDGPRSCPRPSVTNSPHTTAAMQRYSPCRSRIAGRYRWPATPARLSGSPRPAASSLPAPITTMPTRNGCKTGMHPGYRRSMPAAPGN